MAQPRVIMDALSVPSLVKQAVALPQKMEKFMKQYSQKNVNVNYEIPVHS